MCNVLLFYYSEQVVFLDSKLDCVPIIFANEFFYRRFLLSRVCLSLLCAFPSRAVDLIGWVVLCKLLPAITAAVDDADGYYCEFVNGATASWCTWPSCVSVHVWYLIKLCIMSVFTHCSHAHRHVSTAWCCCVTTARNVFTSHVSAKNYLRVLHVELFDKVDNGVVLVLVVLWLSNVDPVVLSWGADNIVDFRVDIYNILLLLPLLLLLVLVLLCSALPDW